MRINEKMNIVLDTTLERDMDLLIIEEFVSDTEFADLLLSPFNICSGYTIDTVIHSKRDSDLGESDIVFVLSINGRKHAIHIENKIDAQAMPNQHDCYAKDIENGEYDTASWMLVAPLKYIAANSEAQKYENHVTYEQLREHFGRQGSTRSAYKLALIDRAILGQKNGYQLKLNPAAEEFCGRMNVYQAEKYPGLPVGTKAWWPYRKTPLQGVPLVFKPNKGYCDLTFSGITTEELSRAVYPYLSERMLVEASGKSSSVRVYISAFSLSEPFDTKQKEVDEALQALQELYELSRKLAATAAFSVDYK